ncbi:hypothetical protein [Desertibacillus haloalkaliphilus]|uniref:hypothetical protein n=1 Tax=Desertibacillus haloalkaliphilus TaxID=1328930 RepID=UPI001C272DEE|nr:hypothetical protein [Desertibacillus haloalkaliphilus]MBU8908476.1 hypothetical protein [Desertibacillus haloalkaliphilus]
MTTQLGMCDKCNRTGRARNLTLFYNQFLCPDCYSKEDTGTSRYEFMLFQWVQGHRVFKIMDFKEGRILFVKESEYLSGELGKEISEAIDRVYEERILSGSHEYNG